MITRLPIVLAAALAACGPASGRGTPAAPAHPAALIVVAPDAATLDRTLTVLGRIGGDKLAVIRFAVPGAEPWPIATYAARGLAVDAPLGLSITGDGVAIRWAGVGDADALRTAIGAVPGAAQWQVDRGELWQIGDTAAIVIADGRVGVVTGGAPSVRDRTVLELASGELAIATEPRAGGLALEVDGAFVVATFAPEPGPILTRLGADLGRIRAGVTAAPEQVTLDVEVHPAADSLAEHLIAGAHGGGILVPAGPFALASHAAPERVLALITELGARRRVDVPAVLQSTRQGVAAIHGDLALGPAGVALRYADTLTMAVITRSVESIVGDLAHDADSATFGAPSAGFAGGGVVVAPRVLATSPPYPIDPPAQGDLVDENTDVPWSQDYRAARKAFEAARAELERVKLLRDNALRSFETERGEALGPAVAIALVADRGGYRGHTEWRPPRGTIAASVAAADAAFATASPLVADIARADAAVTDARHHALSVRASDVQAWDKDHGGK